MLCSYLIFNILFVLLNINYWHLILKYREHITYVVRIKEDKVNLFSASLCNFLPTLQHSVHRVYHWFENNLNVVRNKVHASDSDHAHHRAKTTFMTIIKEKKRGKMKMSTAVQLLFYTQNSWLQGVHYLFLRFWLWIKTLLFSYFTTTGIALFNSPGNIINKTEHTNIHEKYKQHAKEQKPTHIHRHTHTHVYTHTEATWCMWCEHQPV